MTSPTERSLPVQEDSSPQTAQTSQTSPNMAPPALTPDEVTQQFQYSLTQLDLLAQNINDAITHLNQLLDSQKEASL